MNTMWSIHDDALGAQPQNGRPSQTALPSPAVHWGKITSR